MSKKRKYFPSFLQNKLLLIRNCQILKLENFYSSVGYSVLISATSVDVQFMVGRWKNEPQEMDKRILEKGRRCRIRKSEESNETGRQIPKEAYCHCGKERNEVPGISTASEEK
jgi:hypothetical protein